MDILERFFVAASLCFPRFAHFENCDLLKRGYYALLNVVSGVRNFPTLVKNSSSPAPEEE